MPRNKFENDKLIEIINEWTAETKNTRKALYDLTACGSYSYLIHNFHVYKKRLAFRLNVDEDILQTAYDYDEVQRKDIYRICNMPGCGHKFLPKNKNNYRCPSCNLTHGQDEIETYRIIK